MDKLKWKKDNYKYIGVPKTSGPKHLRPYQGRSRFLLLRIVTSHANLTRHVMHRAGAKQENEQ